MLNGLPFFQAQSGPFNLSNLFLNVKRMKQFIIPVGHADVVASVTLCVLVIIFSDF